MGFRPSMSALICTVAPRLIWDCLLFNFCSTLPPTHAQTHWHLRARLIIFLLCGQACSPQPGGWCSHASARRVYAGVCMREAGRDETLFGDWGFERKLRGLHYLILWSKMLVGQAWDGNSAEDVFLTLMVVNHVCNLGGSLRKCSKWHNWL